MRRAILALVLIALAATGCGAAPAKVKGRLVSNGEPMSVSGQVAVTFTALNGDGTGGRSFTAMVNPDGTFDVVVSGGELPPGLYKVSIVAVGKAADNYKGLVGDKSPVRRELRPGPNEITIDVSKPEG
ncbi:MAG TPA: hypothetical protein VGE74_04900 [Gemmata sp.]